jgi:signal transduction histidine kinase
MTNPQRTTLSTHTATVFSSSAAAPLTSSAISDALRVWGPIRQCIFAPESGPVSNRIPLSNNSDACMPPTDNPHDLRNEVERLKHQLAQAAGAQREAERAKTEYMQNVAHQLAAPINAIKMNIDTLKNPRVPVGRKTVLLNSIYCQGTILAHLIKNYSFMSHLEAEHNLDSFREKPEEVDIYLLCVNFANDFQPAAAFKDQKIDVIQEEFQRHRRPKVWIIKNLLSQVIYNLFENATKYADADSTITVGLDADTSAVSLKFRSIGAPISPSEAARIFDRGQRGAAAKALNPAGTGFGLYIARRIMEIHNGTISVAPNGRRTEFCVKIPRKAVA